MATKKTTTTKKSAPKAAAARPKKPNTPPAKPKAAPAEAKRTSAIDAAARLLKETGKPMSTGQMIEQMAAKGYWTSPGGKTPAATLYSAILREIGKKKSDSRFKKTERGLFAYKG